MSRFKEKVNCTNQVEIILPSDRGGPADRYGLPESGAKMKIVVVPGD